MQIHNFRVKHHIPKVEYASLLSSYCDSIYVAQSLLAVLPVFMVSGLLSESIFPHFQRGGGFTHIQTYYIIDLVRNAHFWSLTCILNIFWPFIWITHPYIAQCNFHTFGFPFALLILPLLIILIFFYSFILAGHLRTI